MSALVACCVGYGREAMMPHMEKVRWRGVAGGGSADAA